MSENIFNIMTVNYNKRRTVGAPQVLNVTNDYETARKALLEAYGKGFKDVYLMAEFEVVRHIWFICLDCHTKDANEGVAFSVVKKNSGSCGYMSASGSNDGEKLCDACSANRTLAYIERNDKWTGYLHHDKEANTYQVIDATGRVRFNLAHVTIERKRTKKEGAPYRIWHGVFTDHKGRTWRGKNSEMQGDLFNARKAKRG